MVLVCVLLCVTSCEYGDCYDGRKRLYCRRLWYDFPLPFFPVNSDIKQGPIAVEAFIIFMIFKNMFGFALASPAVTWIAETGTLRIFTIIASVQLAIALTSIPLCELPEEIGKFMLTGTQIYTESEFARDARRFLS